MSNVNNPFTLENKVIVITGASSGIGRQCAVSCSQQGATVILAGRNQQGLNETQGQMANPDKHLCFAFDLTDYEQSDKFVMEIVSTIGRIDGLVNAAGISTTLPLKLTSIKKMEEFFRSNVFGAVNLTKNVAKQTNFNASGGSIVFISSVMATVGETGKSLYGMTKGALHAASKSLAVELAPKKIRINCISPGVVISPMSQKSLYSQDEESLNFIKNLHPLGLGMPEDIAHACIYLLSDASRWVTGTNLIIDGGYTAR